MRRLPVLRVEGWRGLWLPGMFIRVLRFCGRNARVSAETADRHGPPPPGTHTCGEARPGCGALGRGGTASPARHIRPWAWKQKHPEESP